MKTIALIGLLLATSACQSTWLGQTDNTCVAPKMDRPAVAQRLFALAPLPPSAEIIDCVAAVQWKLSGEILDACAVTVDKEEFPRLLGTSSFAERDSPDVPLLVETLARKLVVPLDIVVVAPESATMAERRAYTNVQRTRAIVYAQTPRCQGRIVRTLQE